MCSKDDMIAVPPLFPYEIYGLSFPLTRFLREFTRHMLRKSCSGTRSFRFPLPSSTIQGSLESFCGNTTSFLSFSAIINGDFRFASLFMKISDYFPENIYRV